jgi:hypothetical protein
MPPFHKAFRHLAKPPTAFSRISEQAAETAGVVMLDIWQVACAIELQAAAFWTFDADQEKLARATGGFERVVGLAG